MSDLTLFQDGSDLIYRLRGLAMGGAILHLGAHPDDEDVGLVAYMARKFGARIVYWSATRGEGGQNRIGPEKEEALGVYRTWESLAARAVDGGEALFGPFYDFGFSKSGEETFAKWGGRQGVVCEIVRAIRLVQPQVVISRWTGQPGDGHGHHQAVGQTVAEAFEAAGEPDRFPELRAQDLAAWQPSKLYFSTGGDWQPGESGDSFGDIRPELERDGFLRINTGEFDPIAQRTYQELAWTGFNHHKTQAMGFAPSKGPFYYYYSLSKSLVTVPSKEIGFYDGLDETLTGLADYPGDGSRWLRKQLEAIKLQAQTARRSYRAEDGSQAASPLLEGLSLLRTLQAGLIEVDVSQERRRALASYLGRKAADFEQVAAQCLGLSLECISEYARITPGQRLGISAHLWNHRHIPIQNAKFSLHVPEGWKVRQANGHKAGERSGCLQANYAITVSEQAELTCPYWLTQPRQYYRYCWPKGEPCAQPFNPPLVELECTLIFDAQPLRLRAPAVFREAFAGGYRELPLAVIPPISLHPKNTEEFLQAVARAQILELRATAQSNIEWTGIQGRLTLEAPFGWQVEPGELQLSLDRAGDSQTVTFSVTIPENTPAGIHTLRYVVHCRDRDYNVVLQPVRMGAPGLPRLPDQATCTREEFITTPSTVNIHLIDATFASGLSYAYIKGAEEGILKALSHFNLDVQLLRDEEISYIDLGQFDAILIGSNAYLLRHEVCKNASRLLEYVQQGGTLIVQYQGYAYQRQGFAPYPFEYNRPHDRVTSEHGPITLLEPDHFLFRQPNVISGADFDGWVRDRGLYFFGRWDKRYQPLLASSDPGEEPKHGGLLITSYGRGTFIYAAYSFFRQLPAGVHGAFRLFANILAAPAARILERAGFLKQIPLFAFMAQEQLQAVARIMSERWVADGVYLCHQGDAGDEMYIIVQGEVRIIKKIDGKDQVIYRAGQGEAIGEMQVLSKSPRAAAMRAHGDVHLLVIEGAHFRALMHDYPDMSDRVIQMLVQKLAAAGG